MMKVSVVIPLYNKARHIKRAVDSVLAQTYSDFELIVVDDGSTDGGGDLVREIIDPRIRLIIQENSGECAARNRGVQESACELVAFLDADDEWFPHFLDTVIALRERCPEAGMYASSFLYCRENVTWSPVYSGSVSPPQGGLVDDYFLSALRTPLVTSSSAMIPKRILDEIGGFSPGIRRGGDERTWTQIALRYRVAWSPVNGAVYHLSADNRACINVPVNLDPQAAPVVPIEEFLQTGADSISPRHNVEEYCYARRLNLAISCYLEGKGEWALYNLDKARNTSRFRNKRLFLRVVFCFSPLITKWVLEKRAQIRRIPISTKEKE
jgi:glycosyltransferase involved in cell wall biosynthesis